MPHIQLLEVVYSQICVRDEQQLQLLRALLHATALRCCNCRYQNICVVPEQLSVISDRVVTFVVELGVVLG